MFDFFDLVTFIGGIFRLVGLLVFGVAVGWFTLYAFHQPERKWQLQVAVYLGLLLLAALILSFTAPGGAGMFVLGAGAALLYWGLKKDEEPKPKDETEPEEY
ncbi:MAG: hypothetical protein MUO62_10160 [Anaerolineales bacterium]|nr:hypothetical protein [Anaerolineales bacterium]